MYSQLISGRNKTVFSKYSGNYVRIMLLFKKWLLWVTKRFCSHFPLARIALFGTVLHLPAMGASPEIENRPVIAPDGSHLILSLSVSGKAELYLMDLQTKIARKLTTSKGYKEWPAYSADGSKLAYSKGKKNGGTLHLVVTDPEFKSEIQITDGEFRDYGACFSKDGKTILFCRASTLRGYSLGGKTWDNMDIYSINTDGSELRKITDQHYYFIDPPSLLPDGKFIYGAQELTRYDRKLFVVDPTSTNLVVPFNPKGLESRACLRPSTSMKPNKVVFISYNITPHVSTSPRELWKCDSDGNEVRQITNLKKNIDFPMIDKLGTTIFFLCEYKRESELFVLMRCDVDGTNLVNITPKLK